MTGIFRINAVHGLLNELKALTRILKISYYRGFISPSQIKESILNENTYSDPVIPCFH